jgi:predicted Zn-dependent protease
VHAGSHVRVRRSPTPGARRGRIDPPSPDDALLLDRLDKEATHELGHTFGLVHCIDPMCVMHASTYAEEIDFKGAEFCLQCLEGVRSAR